MPNHSVSVKLDFCPFSSFLPVLSLPTFLHCWLGPASWCWSFQLNMADSQVSASSFLVLSQDSELKLVVTIGRGQSGPTRHGGGSRNPGQARGQQQREKHCSGPRKEKGHRSKSTVPALSVLHGEGRTRSWRVKIEAQKNSFVCLQAQDSQVQILAPLPESCGC